MFDPNAITGEQLNALIEWADLAARDKAGTLSQEEGVRWQQLTASNPELRNWMGALSDEAFTRQLIQRHELFTNQLAAVKTKFYNQIKEANSTPGKTHHRIHFLKTAWVRYAASIIIILGIGAYLWNTSQKKNQEITQTQPVPVKTDILAGRDRAILTLSNGKQVILDSAASQTIKDGTLSIENNNGQLIYKQADRVAMNTMSTPKGGQYQLTLADGTKVWLNAASSITYPTAFTGTSREVSITGEAYFEVATNLKMPFIVNVNPQLAIEVLGTHFNVNSYTNEASLRTTLLEGKVRIKNGTAEQILQQGQQASVSGTSINVRKVNTAEAVAWKDGYFNFEGADLKSVMRQLERWYDIDVRYGKDIPHEIFAGVLPRHWSLQEVLEILRAVPIDYRLEGRTLSIGE